MPLLGIPLLGIPDVIPTTYYVLAGHEVKHPNKKGLTSSYIYIARACNEKHDTSVNYT